MPLRCVEQVQADAIVIANFEKFSSPVKDFLVLGSINYPTDTWLVLGNFTAEYRNGEQLFPLEPHQHVRYIKLRFFSHYGSEYYCTLSQLKYVCCLLCLWMLVVLILTALSTWTDTQGARPHVHSSDLTAREDH